MREREMGVGRVSLRRGTLLVVAGAAVVGGMARSASSGGKPSLAPLRAPCYDDNPLAECCCGQGGFICNAVRTAVTAAMEPWREVHPRDCYVAKALAAPEDGARGDRGLGQELVAPPGWVPA